MNHDDWPETTAEVTKCIFNRPWRAALGSYMVAFKYADNGIEYEGGFMAPNEFQKNETFTIRYDPKHPERNNKDFSPNWSNWYTTVLAALIILALLYFRFVRA